jgi:alpha-tubulin suppressor-like RCC1 family protein
VLISSLLALTPGAQAAAPNQTPLTWGLNHFGQLGAPSAALCNDIGTADNFDCSLVPLSVLPLAGSTNAVALGGMHTLAVRNNGTVAAWGANGNGQLGTASSDTCLNIYQSSRTPLTVPGLSNVTAVAAGMNHSLALVNGTVYAWGANFTGQLGDGTTNSHTAPAAVHGVGGSGLLTGVIAIAASNESSFALRSDGTVVGWGQGPLGDGGYSSRYPVVVVLGGGGTLSGITSIAAGSSGVLALRNDGLVFGWAGANRQAPTNVANQIFTANAPLSNVTAVSVGNHMLALDSSGAVWSWGSNESGQLGTNSTYAFPYAVHTLAPGGSGILTGVSAIAAGGNHSLALKSDGTVLAWGLNEFNALGAPSTGQCRDLINMNHPCSLLPIQVRNAAGTPLTGVSGIAAGAATSAALAAPQVSVNPGSVTFADQAINTTSAARSVALTNSGSAPLAISSIVTAGDFAQTTACGSSVAAGAVCTINITFSPTAVGTRSGTLTIVDNGPGSPRTITLSGTGTPPPAPQVTLNPSSLNLGSIPLGQHSAAQNVTLSNTGNGPLLIYGISTGLVDYTQTNNCPSSLAAGASCTIAVTFAPTAAGLRTATLAVANNAGVVPHLVGLTGTGITSVVSASATSLNFGSVFVGNVATRSVTLTGQSSLGVTVSSVTIAGTGASSYDASAGDGCSGLTLYAGQSCTILVDFEPWTAGVKNAQMSINTSGGTLGVSLTGTGKRVIEKP